VPGYSGDRRRGNPPRRQSQVLSDQDGKNALGDVEQENGRGGRFAKGPQDIRRPSAATADLPQVDSSADPPGDVAPGDGAKKKGSENHDEPRGRAGHASALRLGRGSSGGLPFR
jgi:hypothetical protein